MRPPQVPSRQEPDSRVTRSSSRRQSQQNRRQTRSASRATSAARQSLARQTARREHIVQQNRRQNSLRPRPPRRPLYCADDTDDSDDCEITDADRNTNNDREDENDNDLRTIQNHFNRMRNRAPRRPSNAIHRDASDDDDSSGDSDNSNADNNAYGIQPFNCLHPNYPETPHQFNQPFLEHESNHVCKHCDAILWKEEKHTYNCCNRGRSAMPRLRPIPSELLTVFGSARFRSAQRRYNSLFAFTGLGAGGIEKRSWTQPSAPSMLTLHGRAYHRIFDLQEQYTDMNVTNNARFYIYDSEFNSQSASQHLDSQISNTLRQHVNTNIPWATQYRSAVSIINQTPDDSSDKPYIEFAQVSRANDGPVVGDAISAPEIAALVYNSNTQNNGPRTVVTYPRNSPDNKPRFLPLWSAGYETLQFPMLMLHGEAGWSKGNQEENPPYKSKTMNKTNDAHVTFPFYCRQRLLCEPIFKRNCRITQEWACDSLSRMEEERLTFVEHGPLQRRLATDRSIRQSSSDSQPGKLLPASHPGSMSKRKSDTEDALAIVNRRGKPHLFITVTFNADWKEVKDNLLNGQSAYDRPDLCCRVFKVKLNALMKELKSGRVFGEYDSHLSVIEFQKRGYPHAHILMTFKNGGPDQLYQMDEWVWAQLPSPELANGILREKVLKYMIHKPCGTHNVNSPCMETNRDTNRRQCNKHYPQPFRSTATINDRSGRAEYKRTDNGDNPTIRVRVDGKWQDVKIGNEWVVPYNPYLLLMFDCHICVDVVTATSCVKYLFKYVHKGADYAKARIQGITSEIEQYRKTRYISAAEATWRLLGFQMVSRFPAVTKVHAHLEGDQYVTYPDDATPEQRLQIAEDSPSALMTYFKRPTDDVFTPQTLLDYYEKNTVTKPKKGQEKPTSAPPGKFLDTYGNIISCRSERNQHVCRIVFQSPAVGDLFYLRLLLHTIPGRSFNDLLLEPQPNSIPFQHATFHDAARARGLVTGDEEYTICMEEAASFQVANQLRALFVTLILDGGSAPKLWSEFEPNLIEDFALIMTQEEAIQAALCEIDLKLQLHGKNNEQVNLPAARHSRTELERMKESFDVNTCKEYADTHERNLTVEQYHVYNTVIASVNNELGKPFMIDAPAGTGKTYTEKCLAAKLRGEGKTVLIVASTGIAALQLTGGWTAHSMFKLPMDENMSPSCVCNINAQTQRAELIRHADLIIWDELPMTHRYCVEALNRTLKDLMRNDLLFGGKTILFSGDWRQTGPIVKFGSPTDTVDAAVISSQLWNSISRLRLTKSQRDKDDPAYASFVRKVGEDKIPSTSMPDGTNLIPLNNHSTDCPDKFHLQYKTDFNELVHFVYPNMSDDATTWSDRAILATTNNAIDRSNQIIADERPGRSVSFYSSDSLIKDANSAPTAFAAPEHLNQLNVSGVPPHELKLKSNGLAMIVRNLNFSEGLVNGQKCIIKAVSPNSRVIQVELLTDEHPRPIVLIPRINFPAQVGRNGINFMRVQFPLRTAYAMTINKSQGQTLTRIGLDLRSSPFAHGQLYVALTRAQKRSTVMVLLPHPQIVDGLPYTENVVYSPFIEAATGDTNSISPTTSETPAAAGAPTLPTPPPPPAPAPYWIIQPELGDGNCGFRAIARHVLGDPDLHLHIRTQIVQYISSNRQNPNLHIYNGIQSELLYSAGSYPFHYYSYDDYVAKMSLPATYMGQPEITAAIEIYDMPIHVHFNNSTLPLPQHALQNELHLKFTPNSRHYETFILMTPPPSVPQN